MSTRRLRALPVLLALALAQPLAGEERHTEHRLVESLRRQLMRDNYDYMEHAEADAWQITTGSSAPRRDSAQRRDNAPRRDGAASWEDASTSRRETTLRLARIGSSGRREAMMPVSERIDLHDEDLLYYADAARLTDPALIAEFERNDHTDRVERPSHIDHIGRNEHTERVGRNEHTDRIGRNEHTNRIGRNEHTDRIWRNEHTERVERTSRVNRADRIDHTDPVYSTLSSPAVDTTPRYKLLNVPGGGGRRAMGGRRFLQEERPDHVAILNVGDDMPFPDFRLPLDRRQYMGDDASPEFPGPDYPAPAPAPLASDERTSGGESPHHHSRQYYRAPLPETETELEKDGFTYSEAGDQRYPSRVEMRPYPPPERSRRRRLAPWRRRNYHNNYISHNNRLDADHDFLLTD